jgi:hypothetical protein
MDLKYITQEEIEHKEMPIAKKTKVTKKTSCPMMMEKKKEIAKRTEGIVEKKSTQKTGISRKSETLYNIQLPSETKELFRNIEETDDVRELINLYEDISEKYKVRSLQIDNLIKTPIPEDQVSMLKSYLKDFIFFAPCIRRLRKSEKNFIKNLLEKLKTFSASVEEKKSINRDLVHVMISYIAFVKNLPEKEENLINEKIKSIQRELDFSLLPSNEPSLLWNAMNGDFIEITESLEELIDSGITCDMLFQKLEEVFRMISDEDPKSIDFIPQMKEGLRRFAERQFYIEDY